MAIAAMLETIKLVLIRIVMFISLIVKRLIISITNNLIYIKSSKYSNIIYIIIVLNNILIIIKLISTL